MQRPSLDVRRAGPHTTFQDLGRPGYASIGVGASGAADRASHRLANRLVGNPESTPALEMTLGQTQVVSRSHLILAATGAPAPILINGSPAAHNSPLHVAPGDLVRFGVPGTGMHTYAAVRGGFVVEQVLGSSSYDVLSAIGPPVLRDGDLLLCGDATTSTEVNTDWAPTPEMTDHQSVFVLPGPDADTRTAFAELVGRSWTVGTETNRVGVRLVGRPIEPAMSVGVSQPMLRGAIQLPPDGQPVILGPDHPVTGGYPVVAVVLDRCLDLTGQSRPGGTVSFTAARGAAVRP